MKEILVNANDSGQRIDKFLTKTYPKLPQSMLYKAIRTKRIKLNGKRTDIAAQLCEGDVLQLYINDEFLQREAGQKDFLLAPRGLSIVYEDDNIILLDKPSGLVVHEDESQSPDTLINRITRYLFEKGEYSPEAENSFAPALCNRIDRNTRGIVICAKNAAALRILNEKIRKREVRKFYKCLVFGEPKPREAVIKAYLVKDEKAYQVYVYGKPTAGAKTIITQYRTLNFDGEKALLEIELHTGRTHQIRAHMAYIGCPLVGDGKYGSRSQYARSRELGYSSQALCSYRLDFAFSSEAGELEYLRGKSFSIKGDIFENGYKK